MAGETGRCMCEIPEPVGCTTQEEWDNDSQSSFSKSFDSGSRPAAVSGAIAVNCSKNSTKDDIGSVGLALVLPGGGVATPAN